LISVFRRGANKIFALVGCYTAYICSCYRRFGTNYQFHFQGLLDPWKCHWYVVLRCLQVITKNAA